MILGGLWLTTMDAFIGCRSESMFISRGDSIKQITLYPPTKLVMNLLDVLWYDDEVSDQNIIQPIFTIDQEMSLKDTTKDKKIIYVLCNIYFMSKSDLASFSSINKVISIRTQENSDQTTLLSLCSIPKVASHELEQSSLPIKVSPDKFLYINPELYGQ